MLCAGLKPVSAPMTMNGMANRREVPNIMQNPALLWFQGVDMAFWNGVHAGMMMRVGWFWVFLGMCLSRSSRLMMFLWKAFRKKNNTAKGILSLKVSIE